MQTIEKHYVVEGILGEGSFGTILNVKSRSNGRAYACKLEKKSNIKEVLVEKEYSLLKVLEDTGRFPVPHELGIAEDAHYLVMELLGCSLQQLRMKIVPSRLHIKSVALVAKQVLESLMCMHSKGYLHRDLKPDNILLGPDTHTLYLIDFGLSKKCDPPPRRTVSIIGNVRFASRGAHIGFSSRKDDLESMCYVLLFLYQGWLPWQKLPPEEIKRELERKNTLEGPTELTVLLHMKEELHVGMFEPSTSDKVELLFLEELVSLTRFIQSMDMKQLPDYAEVGYRVGRLLFISGGAEDNCYEWCPSGCRHKRSPRRYWQVYDTSSD